MIVCNRCKKEVSDKFHHILPSFLMDNLEDDSGDNKYHLCDKCNAEYREMKREFDRQFFSRSSSITSIVKKPEAILLESRKSVKSINDNGCDHEWYYVSMSSYDVEGCMGVICKKCGALTCACHASVVSDDYELGDQLYSKFYPKTQK